MMESNLNLSAEGKKKLNGNLMNRSNPDVNKGTKKKKKVEALISLCMNLAFMTDEVPLLSYY